MLLRKITASFLVILFVVLALPNFLIYGLSRTYLNVDFYKRADVVSELHDFTLDRTVEGLRSKSDFFSGYFTPAELREQIASVFTTAIFAEITSDFAGQIEEYKQNPNMQMVLSLRILRDNLLTVANNLAYIIYQKLPACPDAAMPLDEMMVPQCAPPGMPYEEVVRPLTGNFEATIYNQIPEELGSFEQAVPLKALVNVEKYREITFVFLVFILALIALTIYSKISTIIGYVSAAFGLAGAVGYLFGSLLITSVGSMQMEVGDAAVKDFILRMLDFLVAEVQKLSLIFLIVGAALMVIRYVLRQTVDRKAVTVENESDG